MDWKGQKRVEQIMQILLIAFGILGFIAGYVSGSFQTMILVYGAGVVFTSLIVIPDWPFFNRHPLNWLDPTEAEKHPKLPQSAAKKKVSKK
ncbi:hypothetical protein M569_02609 [Genlisea aurea]|uniref:Signal peptidase complex subunit 1 n=1 Tax=Genlisea aurea TaxID=192259 RepID=S8CXG1_9LAMI|nr:hypothetical protein M569_02609 [Genlisea aurea]